MEFVFAIAGIPDEIYPDIVKKFSYIAGRECIFISRSLTKNTYSVSDTKYYLGEFAKLIERTEEHKLARSKFSIIYIDYNDEGSAEFSKSFFPFILPTKIIWNISGGTNASLNKSKNDLIELLIKRVGECKLSLNYIKREITEKASKTPLLLPLKNFDSDDLTTAIECIFTVLVNVPNKEKMLKEVVANFKYKHPPQRIGKNNIECFVDNKNIQFHAPGKSLHGRSRANSGHPIKCLLSGNLRLGAKFSSAFHYDCIKGNNNESLTGYFWGCHEDKSKKSGNPHLNISPNDHVR